MTFVGEPTQEIPIMSMEQMVNGGDVPKDEAQMKTIGPLRYPRPVAGKIYAAMPAIMREVGAVEKGRRNTQQGYDFRGIDDVYAAVQLVLAKNGVFVMPCVVATEWSERATKNGGLMFHLRARVEHTFYAEGGSSVVAVTLGEAMDTGDKCSNKAMSAAMKYALIEALCIPTREPKDTENESPEVAAPAPKAPPRQSSPSAASAAPSGKPAAASTAKVQQLIIELKKTLGDDRDKRLAWLSWALGRPVTSGKEIFATEIDGLIERAKNGEVPS